MKALFEVGEEVIVVSERRPELNGEYVIESIRNNGERKVRYSDGVVSKEPSYLLSGIEPYAFLQSSLRKKHKPSDFDFNELMSEIKDLVIV